MPYDWSTGGPLGQRVRVDPAATACVGHPAWLNPLYGGAPGGITYHTYTPQSNVGVDWALPKGTTLGFTKGKGYYARPGTAPAAGGAKPAAGGIPSLDAIIRQIYGGIESPAQQEARINREVNAQVAAQQKMIEDMYARQRADALRIMEGQSLAGQAAAAMNKDLFSAVGGEYNAAAGEIKGLAHGLSKNAAGATAGDVGKANAALAALGNAPVLSGGTFGVGGETQRGVEEYRGGTLPAQEF